MEIQHFSHNHALTLHEGNPKPPAKCSCCDLPLSPPLYNCSKCNFSIHKSCSEMPQHLNQTHIFHPIPTHLLSLLSHPPRSSRTFNCYVCEKPRRGFSYHCPQCPLDICVNCISLVPSDNTDDYQQISPPNHDHPFILCKKHKEFELSCIGCHRPIKEESLYLCPICILFFHESCANPPPQIRHPFHSRHPLTLLYEPPDSEGVSFRCKACGRHGSGGSYHCDDCSFNMHVICSLIMPKIQISGIHQHPLAFFDYYVHIAFRCHACDGRIDGPFFRCVECDFNLHLDCFPWLPNSVKHKSHRHFLTITDSPIKDYSDEEDDAEFYCDACEKRRNLFDRSYYCAELDCHFVAHTKCLIPEILCLLEEESSSAYKHEDTKLDASDIVNEQSDEMTSSGSVGKEALENLTLAELDDEIVKLRVEMEALAAKLGAFERRRAHLASSSI